METAEIPEEATQIIAVNQVVDDSAEDQTGQQKGGSSFEALCQAAKSELQNISKTKVSAQAVQTDSKPGDRESDSPVSIYHVMNVVNLVPSSAQSVSSGGCQVVDPMNVTIIDAVSGASLGTKNLKLVYSKASSVSGIGAASLPTEQTVYCSPSNVGRPRKHPAPPGRYICPHCGRGCAKPSVLEKHIRAHTGERPYPCEPCGIAFKTKSNLYKHLKSRVHHAKVGSEGSTSLEYSTDNITDQGDSTDFNAVPGIADSESSDTPTVYFQNQVFSQIKLFPKSTESQKPPSPGINEARAITKHDRFTLVKPKEEQASPVKATVLGPVLSASPATKALGGATLVMTKDTATGTAGAPIQQVHTHELVPITNENEFVLVRGADGSLQLRKMLKAVSQPMAGISPRQKLLAPRWVGAPRLVASSGATSLSAAGRSVSADTGSANLSAADVSTRIAQLIDRNNAIVNPSLGDSLRSRRFLRQRSEQTFASAGGDGATGASQRTDSLAGNELSVPQRLLRTQSMDHALLKYGSAVASSGVVSLTAAVSPRTSAVEVPDDTGHSPSNGTELSPEAATHTLQQITLLDDENVGAVPVLVILEPHSEANQYGYSGKLLHLQESSEVSHATLCNYKCERCDEVLHFADQKQIEEHEKQHRHHQQMAQPAATPFGRRLLQSQSAIEPKTPRTPLTPSGSLDSPHPLSARKLARGAISVDKGHAQKSVIFELVDPTQPPKRGRPKGAKNVPKAEGSLDSDSESSFSKSVFRADLQSPSKNKETPTGYSMLKRSSAFSSGSVQSFGTSQDSPVVVEDTDVKTLLKDKILSRKQSGERRGLPNTDVATPSESSVSGPMEASPVFTIVYCATSNEGSDNAQTPPVTSVADGRKYDRRQQTAPAPPSGDYWNLAKGRVQIISTFKGMKGKEMVRQTRSLDDTPPKKRPRLTRQQSVIETSCDAIFAVPTPEMKVLTKQQSSLNKNSQRNKEVDGQCSLSEDISEDREVFAVSETADDVVSTKQKQFRIPTITVTGPEDESSNELDMSCEDTTEERQEDSLVISESMQETEIETENDAEQRAAGASEKSKLPDILNALSSIYGVKSQLEIVQLPDGLVTNQNNITFQMTGPCFTPSRHTMASNIEYLPLSVAKRIPGMIKDPLSEHANNSSEKQGATESEIQEPPAQRTESPNQPKTVQNTPNRSCTDEKQTDKEETIPKDASTDEESKVKETDKEATVPTHSNTDEASNVKQTDKQETVLKHACTDKQSNDKHTETGDTSKADEDTRDFEVNVITKGMAYKISVPLESSRRLKQYQVEQATSNKDEDILTELPAPLKSLPAVVEALVGHSLPMLRSTTHTTLCSVHKPQPSYVEHSATGMPRLSMYSTWRTAQYDPNPRGLTTRQLLRLYRTPRPPYAGAGNACDWRLGLDAEQVVGAAEADKSPSHEMPQTTSVDGVQITTPTSGVVKMTECIPVNNESSANEGPDADALESNKEKECLDDGKLTSKYGTPLNFVCPFSDVIAPSSDILDLTLAESRDWNFLKDSFDASKCGASNQLNTCGSLKTGFGQICSVMEAKTSYKVMLLDDSVDMSEDLQTSQRGQRSQTSTLRPETHHPMLRAYTDPTSYGSGGTDIDVRGSGSLSVSHVEIVGGHTDGRARTLGSGAASLDRDTGAGGRISLRHLGFKSEEEYTYIRGRGRGKYVCRECGIRCKKPSMLKKHLRSHTDLRPYVCKYCRIAFKTKGNLTKHMKSKAHQKRCHDLGIPVAPEHLDDSWIERHALEMQASFPAYTGPLGPTTTGDQPYTDGDESYRLDDSGDPMDEGDEDSRDFGVAEEDYGEEEELEEEQVDMDNMVVLESPNSAGSSRVPMRTDVLERRAKRSERAPVLLRVTTNSQGDTVNKVVKFRERAKHAEGSRRNPDDKEVAASLLDLATKTTKSDGDTTEAEDSGESVAIVSSTERYFKQSGAKKHSDPAFAVIENPMLYGTKSKSPTRPTPTTPSADNQSETPLARLSKSSQGGSGFIPPKLVDKAAKDAHFILKIPSEMPKQEIDELVCNVFEEVQRDNQNKVLLEIQMTDPPPNDAQSHLMAYDEDIGACANPQDVQTVRLSAQRIVANKAIAQNSTVRLTDSLIRQMDPSLLGDPSMTTFTVTNEPPQGRPRFRPPPLELVAIATDAGVPASPSPMSPRRTLKRQASFNEPDSSQVVVIGGSTPEAHGAAVVPAVFPYGKVLKLANSGASPSSSASSAPVVLELANKSSSPTITPTTRVITTAQIVLSIPSDVGQNKSAAALYKGLLQRKSPPVNIAPIPGRSFEAEPRADGKFECRLCHKLFPESHLLQAHLKVHELEAPVRCDTCAVSFRSVDALLRHAKTHGHRSLAQIKEESTDDNPRPYACEDCQIAFRVHGHLAKHLRSKSHLMTWENIGKLPQGTSMALEEQGLQNAVSVVDAQSCLQDVLALLRSEQLSVDTSNFAWPESATASSVSNTSVSTLEVSAASAMTKSSAFKESTAAVQAQTPSRHSTSTVSHQCGICRQGFRDLATLEDHVASHQIRPYMCRHCDAGFTTGVSLQAHLATHSEANKENSCEICHLSFDNVRELVQHLQTTHAEGGPSTKHIPADVVTPPKASFTVQKQSSNILSDIRQIVALRQQKATASQAPTPIMRTASTDRVKPPVHVVMTAAKTLASTSHVTSTPSTQIHMTSSVDGSTSAAVQETSEEQLNTNQEPQVQIVQAGPIRGEGSSMHVIQLNQDAIQMKEEIQRGPDGVEQRVKVMVIDWDKVHRKGQA